MNSKMLPEELQSFLSKDSTQVFLRCAEDFVRLMEQKDIDQATFNREFHSTLVNLYTSGHHLEEVELKYATADKEFDRASLFVNANAMKVSGFGKDAFYWEIFDPAYSEMDKEPTQGFLVDDCIDIYHDLKIELNKLKLGTAEAVEDALWQMKFSHKNHWGQHCINALRCLHFLWYDGRR